MRSDKSRRRFVFLCVAPATILFFLFMILPTLNVFRMSLYESGAIQPVLGIADDLEGDNKMFYSVYDNGAKAAMGNFAAFSAIPGVEVRTVFFDPVNSLVSGSMTEQQWIDGIKSASDQMRANIVE